MHDLARATGLVVMAEGYGQAWLPFTGYCFGIGLILTGLVILCRGEPAFKELHAGERAALNSQTDAQR